MRRSGILLPVFSLPSRHGIGKMGRAAYEFVDFLKGAEVSCWQVLPLSPTGYGDSPYQSCCTYAGNPYLIDFDLLAEEGLLVPADYDGLNWGEDSSTIPYALLYTQCYEVLRIAFSNAKPDPDFDAFVEAQKDWLEDYALYMALKFAHDGKPFTEWGRSLRRRKKEAMDLARETYKEDIAFHKFIQYQFFKQWYRLKAYANEQGISIIGDLPIYTAADSVEVWAHPELFELNVLNRPAEVAGCPPDCFSATGQLWGNPVYRWKQHRVTGYAWWIHRLGYVSKLFDMVRIDHFRGFESYYSIPAKKETAEYGAWMPGPGLELFRAAQQKLGNLILFVDDNKAQIDGYVSQINEMESYVDKFKSFHWDAVEINGHDYNAIHEAILNAKAVQDKPSAIILHTIKGKGCTFAERTWCHHISVSKEDMEEALQALQA